MQLMVQKERSSVFEFGLFILLVSNVCFYSIDVIKIYIVTSALGVICVWGGGFLKKNYYIHFDSCVFWLSAIYGLFTLYGLCFLRYGSYNWDMMIYTYVQNLSLYIAFKNILLGDDRKKILSRVSVFAAIIIDLYLAIIELPNIIMGGTRIGDSLSGNVNTVGAFLGIISVFVAFSYISEKRISFLVVFLCTVALMLLTGSKMTFFILAMDMVLFLIGSKEKMTSWLFVGIGCLFFIFLIFNVDFFYNVIGTRIEDMIFQLLGIGKGHYSNSTSQRTIMIREGFNFFLEYPIFGGGEKYFGYRTSTIYDYSHCNYTELLCNFGLFGTFLYYVPFFLGISRTYKIKEREFQMVRFLCLVLCFSRLILDWMTVTYSEPCVGYIPMIFSFALNSANKSRKKRV